MALQFRNFLSASRKRNLSRFSLMRPDQDLSWIDNAPEAQQRATVAYSATPTFDPATGTVLSITLTGNVTSSTIATGAPVGQQMYLRIVQDGTGGHTFALPSSALLPSGLAIDSRANYATILPLEWNGAKWELFSEAFSFDTTGTGASRTLTGKNPITTATVTGTVDGQNAVFTLSQAPTPGGGGQLVYVNGVYQKATKYSVSGTTLTFQPGYIPANGASIDVLVW